MSQRTLEVLNNGDAVDRPVLSWADRGRGDAVTAWLTPKVRVGGGSPLLNLSGAQPQTDSGAFNKHCSCPISRQEVAVGVFPVVAEPPYVPQHLY